jgi:hypothetical protein
VPPKRSQAHSIAQQKKGERQVQGKQQQEQVQEQQPQVQQQQEQKQELQVQEEQCCSRKGAGQVYCMSYTGVPLTSAEEAYADGIKYADARWRALWYPAWGERPTESSS